MFPSDDIDLIEERLSAMLNSETPPIDTVMALMLVAQRLDEVAGLLERHLPRAPRAEPWS